MPAIHAFVRCLAALAALFTLGIHAADRAAPQDPAAQFQMATQFFDSARYRDAVDAYDLAMQAEDAALVKRARKGKVRAALRIAEFDIARREAETLTADAPADVEAQTLYGDALWSAGLFDESDRAYGDAVALSPGSSRARLGIARSLATRNHLDEALDQALTAVAASPRDGDIHAVIGHIYQRLNRYDEAATAYTDFVNLLPNKDASLQAASARAHVRFLRAFAGRIPVDIDEQDNNMLHTVPFRLVANKIVVQGRVNNGRSQDFVLDTGSEEAVISNETAQRAGIRAVAYTLSAGVGDVGIRGLQVARIDRFQVGTLEVSNLPVLIKNPALRGMPKREGESFSPLALNMSMTIDYEKRRLTIGRALPEGAPDFRMPMRMHRLAMVRGMLNSTHPAYFVVDTGGEVISISAETANSLEKSSFRQIPLKVYGTSGWDRNAFLMPGVNLDFDQIAYRNFPLVVLDLRTPSVLLGFQLGGIVGHRFLGDYRVSMDMKRSELRLEKF